VLSTHILPEVELLCDRVMIIDRGKVVAEGSPDSLRASSTGDAIVRVLLKDPTPDAAEALAALPGVASLETASDGAYELRCAGSDDPSGTGLCSN
jgi:ABC-2 type transport system ATP-binding protein